MGHGLPDWYRGVDIAYQALAQLIVRPKYGAAQISDVTKAVNAGGLTEFYNISGKGVTYIQWIYVEGTATQKNDYGVLIIDGVNMGTPTFEESRKGGFTFPVSAFPTLGTFDEVNFYYSFYFGRGYTFESTCVGYYIETHGRTPSVRKGLVYALV